MSKPVNISGQRFERLVAEYPTDKRNNGRVVWHCRCDCGGTHEVRQDALRRHDVKSCPQCNTTAGHPSYALSHLEEEICQQFKLNLSTTELAQRYGASSNAIRKLLRRCGAYSPATTTQPAQHLTSPLPIAL